MSGTATSPVWHVDIEALAGLLAVTLGNLLGGDVDDRTIAKLTRKFDQVGLLARTGDTAPSAGQLGVAIEGLLQRLQYALGDLPVEAEPRRDPVTVHQLAFDTESRARRGTEVLEQRIQETGQHEEFLDVRMDDGDGEWHLEVIHTGLPPDHAFTATEEFLRKVADTTGGRYRGSQGR